jgi:hypothetical protein
MTGMSFALYKMQNQNQHKTQTYYQGVEKQASGRQPRRAAIWKAQPIH